MMAGNYCMQFTNKNKYSVLAISYGHEANASIMINGKIVASAAEERFTKKCQMGYPKMQLTFV